MGDLADVEDAFVAALVPALFPTGGYATGAASIAGLPTLLYRGWPVTAQLDADLLAGKAHVTVFPETGMTRLTTRYTPAWFNSTAGVPTLTASVAGQVVTFGGTGGAGQVAAVQFGASAMPRAYAVRLGANDTPSTVAAALAAKISGSSAVGAVLTIPTAFVIQATVAADTTAMREVRRQEQGVRVSVWTPTPDARDALAGAVDLALANMLDSNGEPSEFLALPDGSAVRVRYRRNFTDDKPGKDHLWTRQLCYTAEYGTTAVQAFPLMLFGGGLLNPAQYGTIPPT